MEKEVELFEEISVSKTQSDVNNWAIQKRVKKIIFLCHHKVCTAKWLS